jgi:O-antigen/teichoic acid export membrane protein
MLIFSGWNIFGCGAVVGATQGVNILLNLFFGPVVNAARGIAVQVSGAITAFVNNFQTAVNPQIVKLYAAGKIDELHSLLFQNAKFSFCLMWLLLLPVTLKLEVILDLWLIEVPEHTPLFCRLVLLQALIASTQRPFVMAIHATGKIKIPNVTGGIVLLLVLPISYYFLRAGYAAYIPFVIYIFGFLVSSSIEIFLLNRWINLSINDLIRRVYIPITSIVLCSLPASFIINRFSSDTFISLIFVIAISVILVSVSTYYIALSKKIRKRIIKLVMSKIGYD